MPNSSRYCKEKIETKKDILHVIEITTHPGQVKTARQTYRASDRDYNAQTAKYQTVTFKLHKLKRSGKHNIIAFEK